MTQGPEQIPPVSLVPGEIGIADVEDGLLAVAEQKRIDEVSNRLRVEGARPAGDHQRMRCVALARQQRNTPEVEHHQDVSVGQLVLETKADDVELRDRRLRLEGQERCFGGKLLGELLLGREEKPLAHDVVFGVEQAIDRLEAEV